MADNIDEIIGSIHSSFKHIVSMQENKDQLNLYTMINLYYDLMTTVGKMLGKDSNSSNKTDDSELDILNKLMKEINDQVVNLDNFNEYKQNYSWAHYNLSHSVGIYNRDDDKGEDEPLNDNTLFMLCKDYYVQGVATQHALLLKSKLVKEDEGLNRYIERTLFILQQAKQYIYVTNLDEITSDLNYQFNEALKRCINEIHSEKLSKLTDYGNNKVINV